MTGKSLKVCDNFGIATILLDNDYKILEMNINKEIAILKRVHPQVKFAVGKNFLDLVSQEYREKVKETLENAKNEGTGQATILNSEKEFGIYLRAAKIERGFVVILVDVSGMVHERRELIEKENELELVNNFVREISSTLEIDELCEKAYRELSKVVINMNSFAILIVDEDEKEMWAEYVVGEGKKYEKRKFPLNDKDTLSGWVATHRKELYIKNINKEKLPADYKIIGFPMLSWLGIPLIHRDSVIGVLSVQSEIENAFSERDLRLLRLIAGQLSMAIYNAIIYSALKRSEEMYRVAVNNSLIGIVTTNVNDEITFVNRAMADILGYTPEEVIGKKIYEFATEKGKIALREGNKRRLQGISDTYEAEMRRKDGSVVPVMIYASPFKDEKGNMIGTMGAIADISQIKEMENQLRKSNEFLKLLLHIIGHDLKNPLSVISGYAELISEDPNPEYGKGIMQGVERANSLISDIRLLLRMEMSEEGKEREEYSLLEVIKDAITMVMEKYPDAKIENRVKDEKICGHKLLMRQALMNILMNAFKYGSTKVKITSEKKDGKIVLKIADNGIGISDDKKERVFEPFVKFGTGGSGLGLHIVKKVISLHDAKVWVENNVPKGSVFVIELPIADKCK